MKRRALILISLAAALVAALVWALLTPTPVKEPLYQGKPLSYWFSDEAFARASYSSSLSQSLPHLAAVRELGTNSIPTLLHLMRARDSGLKLKLVALARKQHFVQINFTPATNLNTRAIEACSYLGPAASNAVPDLIALFERSNSKSCKGAALACLGSIGPAAKSAVPALVKIVDAPDPYMSMQARRALDGIDPQAYDRSLIVPSSPP